MAKTKDDIAAQMREVVCKFLDAKPEQVTDTARLVEDLGADELDCVELIIEMEERYGIAVENEEAEKVATFGALVNLVYDKLSKGGGHGE